MAYAHTSAFAYTEPDESIAATNLQAAIDAVMTTTNIEYKYDENGVLGAYAGDLRITDMDWGTALTNTSTSADITISDGTGSYSLTETVNDLKDEIQMLKDEINNLKMLLLEN